MPDWSLDYLVSRYGRKHAAENLRELVLRNTMCRLHRHSRPQSRVMKFNGGNVCWLCRNCRLIIRYGYER